jgi:hypothetical protein
MSSPPKDHADVGTSPLSSLSKRRGLSLKITSQSAIENQ